MLKQGVVWLAVLCHVANAYYHNMDTDDDDFDTPRTVYSRSVKSPPPPSPSRIKSYTPPPPSPSRYSAGTKSAYRAPQPARIEQQYEPQQVVPVIQHDVVSGAGTRTN